MKKIYFFVVFVLFTLLTQGQQATAPTLSAGLDHVTYKQGTLDVELIAKIISEKQQELVREGIKRMIFKVIGNSRLDDYSQFYIERITEILFQEKNHKVMTKRLLEESTNYLFVLGTTKLVLESKNEDLKSLFTNNEEIDNIETTNLLKDTKPLILDDFNKKIGDIDISTRNQIIKTVLTICSEIPEIKQLGLLNNFNYYEHFQIYDKSFVKNILDDFKKTGLNNLKANELFDSHVNRKLKKINNLILSNITSNPENSRIAKSISLISNKKRLLKEELKNKKQKLENFKKLKKELTKNKKIKKILAENNLNSQEINIKIENLELDLKSKFKFNEYYTNKESVKLLKEKIKNISKNKIQIIKAFTPETSKEIKEEIKSLVNYIIEKHKINDSKKVLTKIIQSGKFNLEKFKKYKKIYEIIYFIQQLLSKGNIIKDALNKSGIDFNKNDKTFEEIIKKYQKNFDDYDNDDLIFKDVNINNQKESKIDTNTLNSLKTVSNYIERIEKEFRKKYIVKNIINAQNDIKIEITNFKRKKNIYDSISRLDHKNNQYTISKNISSEIEKLYPDIEIDSNNTEKKKTIDKTNYEKIKVYVNDVANLDYLYKFLNEKKKLLQIIHKRSDNEKTSLTNLINLKTNNSDDDSSKIKNIASDIELGKSYIDSITKETSRFATIKKNYDTINRICEKLHSIKDGEKVDSIIKQINTSNLFEDYKENTEITFERLEKIQENLNLLKGTIFVKGYSKTGDNSLFYMIKKYLITKPINLDNNNKLSDSERKTLEKLNSFFLDRNIDKRLESLEIVSFFDNKFLSELLVLSNKIKGNNDGLDLNKLLSSIEFAISNKIIEKARDTKNSLKINNINKLTDFLKFIGNIKELNKAETFAFLLKTMNDYEYLFANSDGDRKLIPDLINSLREYAIIDLKNNLIEIDVASVLTHMLEKYQKDRRWSFYVTVGLNQYWLNNDLKDSDGKPYDKFNAASEKIGAKFKIWNFNEKPLFEDKLIHKVKRKALVSDIYTMPYVSGLLYKIANTSGKNYDSANIGVALGLTFFNSLDFNVSYSVPMEGQVFKNSMFGVSFDIPLSEYLKRLKL